MTEIIEFDKNKVQLFRQSNSLIESVYQATLTEKRIISMMISMIRPEHIDFKDYKIDINHFAELFEIKGNSVLDLVKKSTENLLSRTIKINDGDKFLQINWISSAEYKKGSSEVIVRFDPKLKPYLLNLRGGYTTTLLGQVAKFKSVYAIRLYELFKQYFPNIRARKFEIQNLKKLLGCDEDYANYANFKARVINRAISEINNLSDLFITFEEEKEGRKIVQIIFNISEKNAALLPKDAPPLLPGDSPQPQETSRLNAKEAPEKDLKKYHAKNNYKCDFEKWWLTNQTAGWKGVEDRFSRLDLYEKNHRQKFPEKYIEKSVATAPQKTQEDIEQQKKRQEFQSSEQAKEILKKIKNNFDENIYNKWLAELTVFDLVDGNLTLEAPSKFIRDWVLREFDKDLKNLLSYNITILSK